ncbi:winged helix-turn-helix domain-containing protein [Piscinibacter sp. HJYY11]|uniref:winged helix-turn-helix domain-containing protein n=1 Tax=Piscinibacter sp. HJYY11 TaxID=2801333 RepID=UPI00191EAD09|nr:LysR family transcriptional regulator [Piscinibacter sp. HJYY11]MBL0726353.1 LysR family transcriptional regulator [Piscinibacter sp. HJYY11]
MKKPAPSAKFRFRITVGDAIAIGPGKVALLEAIAATGSISAAAQSLDMSYRRAWLLLDEMNRMLRAPVADSARGGAVRGGSEITEVGRQLIETYRRIEAKAAEACADEIRQLQSLID